MLGAVLAGAVGAAEPPSHPVLRIETPMHTGMVRRLAVDWPRNRLVTAGDDKTIRIWRLPKGRLERVLRVPIDAGHEGKLFALALSPDGRIVAAGGWTGWAWDRQASLYLFDADTGEMVRRVTGFPEAIGAVAFSPDGRFLAVGLQSDGRAAAPSDHRLRDRRRRRRVPRQGHGARLRRRRTPRGRGARRLPAHLRSAGSGSSRGCAPVRDGSRASRAFRRTAASSRSATSTCPRSRSSTRRTCAWWRCRRRRGLKATTRTFRSRVGGRRRAVRVRRRGGRGRRLRSSAGPTAGAARRANGASPTSALPTFARCPTGALRSRPRIRRSASSPATARTSLAIRAGARRLPRRRGRVPGLGRWCPDPVPLMTPRGSVSALLAPRPRAPPGDPADAELRPAAIAPRAASSSTLPQDGGPLVVNGVGASSWTTSSSRSHAFAPDDATLVDRHRLERPRVRGRWDGALEDGDSRALHGTWR